VQWPLDVEADAGQAQTALLSGLEILGKPLDHRIDERRSHGVGTRLKDEHPPQDAELGRREANAHRPVHDRHHPLGLAVELGAEVLHLRGLRAQDRVPVLDDLR
jgi:hypothetical protein